VEDRVKRLIALPIATISMLIGSLAVGAAPAYAFPTSHFFGVATWGATVGDLTWYNRSVGVTGNVTDNIGGSYTKVRFDFWAGERQVFLSSETRTITSDTRGFNFTEPGPVGGITVVDVTLCTGPAATESCALVDSKHRP
jgi:hypothetical protein